MSKMLQLSTISTHEPINIEKSLPEKKMFPVGYYLPVWQFFGTWISDDYFGISLYETLGLKKFKK